MQEGLKLRAADADKEIELLMRRPYKQACWLGGGFDRLMALVKGATLRSFCLGPGGKPWVVIIIVYFIQLSSIRVRMILEYNDLREK